MRRDIEAHEATSEMPCTPTIQPRDDFPSMGTMRFMPLDGYHVSTSPYRYCCECGAYIAVAEANGTLRCTFCHLRSASYDDSREVRIFKMEDVDEAGGPSDSSGTVRPVNLAGVQTPSNGDEGQNATLFAGIEGVGRFASPDGMGAGLGGYDGNHYPKQIDGADAFEGIDWNSTLRGSKRIGEVGDVDGNNYADNHLDRMQVSSLSNTVDNPRPVDLTDALGRFKNFENPTLLDARVRHWMQTSRVLHSTSFIETQHPSSMDGVDDAGLDAWVLVPRPFDDVFRDMALEDNDDDELADVIKHGFRNLNFGA
ncbi:hypothetical protein G7046_g262 [Stylonectria norvegica]|nr:hypothetical protein G7046_g262 [Stylonectria norvegica]